MMPSNRRESYTKSDSELFEDVLEEMQEKHKCSDVQNYCFCPRQTNRPYEKVSKFDKNRCNSENKEIKYISRLAGSKNVLNQQRDTSRRVKVKTFSPDLRKESYLDKFQRKKDMNKKTLVLDLDETLVHSTFEVTTEKSSHSSMIINVQWNDGQRDKVFVKIRPYAHQFLVDMCKIFEVVIFTASIINYAYPLVQRLDKQKYGFTILNREHCSCIDNSYYKDLSKLGRDLKDVIIVDNNPNGVINSKVNCIPILSWYNDFKDEELRKVSKILKVLSQVEDVRDFIPKFIENDSIIFAKACKILKIEEEISAFDGFLRSLKNFKNEIKSLFSGNTTDLVLNESSYESDIEEDHCISKFKTVNKRIEVSNQKIMNPEIENIDLMKDNQQSNSKSKKSVNQNGQETINLKMYEISQEICNEISNPNKNENVKDVSFNQPTANNEDKQTDKEINSRKYTRFTRRKHSNDYYEPSRKREANESVNTESITNNVDENIKINNVSRDTNKKLITQTQEKPIRDNIDADYPVFTNQKQNLL